MTTVELHFPARRYHGTPWGRHVNEGVPEWPPSPYRLLRAMYDAWQRKCPHVPEESVRELMMALASELPVFRMPKVVAAHTRSYLSSNTEDPTDKSLIFDAFVALAPTAACYLEWKVNLTPEQRRTLDELLGALNYLGRSESWVEAAVSDRLPEGLTSCEPAHATGISGELVYISCPVAPEQYQGKRQWFDALTYSTSEMLKERRSEPPAMRNVPYVRESGAVETWLSPKPRRNGMKISAVALSLSGKVLPLATETVRVAERVRAALMKRIGTGISPLFHGKDAMGRPLQGHKHLFILPQADPSGRIRRVLLFARGGEFDERELQAILGFRVLPRLGDYPCRVMTTWAGSSESDAFRREVKTVVSTTPFVSVRHWRKGRGELADFLIEEVRRECRNHGLPQPFGVTFAKLAAPFQPIQFRRNRKDDPPRPGYAFRVEFAEPVRAPFSLGYGCHFGLGQFDGEA
ncbi:MAG: type I-U CRISPR-associated protein Csb2 [Acidobacteriota bacterium]